MDDRTPPSAASVSLREQIGRLIWPLTWIEQEYGTAWEDADGWDGREKVLAVADEIIRLGCPHVAPSDVQDEPHG